MQCYNLKFSQHIYTIISVIGGNQRDLARAKNAKKQQDLIKAKGREGDSTKRKERWAIDLHVTYFVLMLWAL